MSDDSQEFVTEPVPEAHRVGWIRVGLISAMVGFSLPTFVAGVEVFQVTLNDRATLAVLMGCAMLAFIGALTGLIGARTHLSSYMLARIAFGVKGVNPRDTHPSSQGLYPSQPLFRPRLSAPPG